MRKRSITPIDETIADHVATLLEDSVEEYLRRLSTDPAQYDSADLQRTCDDMTHVARKLRGSERRPTRPDMPAAIAKAAEEDTTPVELVDAGWDDDEWSDDTPTLVEPLPNMSMAEMVSGKLEKVVDNNRDKD